MSEVSIINNRFDKQKNIYPHTTSLHFPARAIKTDTVIFAIKTTFSDLVFYITIIGNTPRNSITQTKKNIKVKEKRVGHFWNLPSFPQMPRGALRSAGAKQTAGVEAESTFTPISIRFTRDLISIEE